MFFFKYIRNYLAVILWLASMIHSCLGMEGIRSPENVAGFNSHLIAKGELSYRNITKNADNTTYTVPLSVFPDGFAQCINLAEFPFMRLDNENENAPIIISIQESIDFCDRLITQNKTENEENSIIHSINNPIFLAKFKTLKNKLKSSSRSSDKIYAIIAAIPDFCTFYGYTFTNQPFDQDLSKQNKKQETKIASLQKDLREQQIKIRELEDQLAISKVNLISKQGNDSAVNEILKTKYTEIDSLEKKISSLQQDLATFQTLNNERLDQIVGIKKNVAILTEEKTNLENNLKRQENQANKLAEEKIEKAKKEVATAKEELARVQAELKIANNLLKPLKEELNTLNSKHATIVTELTQENEKAEQQITDMKLDLTNQQNSASNQYKEHENEVDSLNEKHKLAIEKLESKYKSEVNKLQNQLNKLAEGINSSTWFTWQSGLAFVLAIGWMIRDHKLILSLIGAQNFTFAK